MKHLMNHLPEALLLLFLIITFLQSGIDKVLDWKGNKQWLTGHFASSPLKNSVPLLLGIVMLTELAAGLTSLLGLILLGIQGSTDWALIGALLSCIALLMLLFGQRMAKEYEGAKTIVIYFIPAIFLVFLLH